MGTLDSFDGLVAVNGNDENVATSFRLPQQMQMTSMKKVKAAVRENNFPIITASFGRDHLEFVKTLELAGHHSWVP